MEIAEIGNRYRDVCKAEGKRAVSQDAFIAEAAAFCEAVGLNRKTIGVHLYLMDCGLPDGCEAYIPSQGCEHCECVN